MSILKESFPIACRGNVLEEWVKLINVCCTKEGMARKLHDNLLLVIGHEIIGSRLIFHITQFRLKLEPSLFVQPIII